MRVAMIEPVGGHGGMNFYDFGLCAGLARAGMQVTLYTCDETQPPAGATYQVRREFRGIYGQAPKLLRAARFASGLIRSLAHAKWRLRAQLVHYHFFHFTALERLCVQLAKALGFRVVLTIHDVESFSGDFHSALARSVTDRVDRIVCHNEVSREEVEKKLGVPTSRISTVPHGNYLDFISDSASQSMCRAALGLPADAEIVLFFGQVKKVKGLDVLLRAFSELKQRRAAAHLVIAGKLWKDDESTYTELIQELGIQHAITATFRYIPDEDVAHYYRAADLVALPYRRIYQSGVLLMAMSYGVPVVVSDLPGMLEVVTAGQTGYVFGAEDAASLTNAMEDALSNGDTRAAIARAARELMSGRYAWDRIGVMTLAAYSEVLHPGFLARSSAAEQSS